jgi:hypothetical protein
MLYAQGASAPTVQDARSAPVRAAVQRDFSQFVQYQLQARGNGLPPEFPLDISDIQDLKDARIAYGFPLYTIDPAELIAGRSDLRAMAKPNGIWRFVIAVKGRPVGMATVEQVNGQWETVAYGAAVLAKDLDAAIGVHADSTHSNVRFIRVYQAQSDFLEVASPSAGKARYLPLHSARQSLLLQQRSAKNTPADSGDGLLDSSELLNPLRAAVKTNLDAMR